jgi:hypothetical protein
MRQRKELCGRGKDYAAEERIFKFGPKFVFLGRHLEEI